MFLSESSTRDQKWDYHASNRFQVARNFLEADFSLHKRGFNIFKCSNRLKFWVTGDGLILSVPTQQELLKKGINHFCRDRLCPSCQWRRSLRWKAEAHSMMDVIKPLHPLHRWIFMTLTVRSCHVSNLRDTLNLMSRSLRNWFDVTKHSPIHHRWPAVGWIKSTEITFDFVTGYCHPHFHILMMVEPDYYDSSKYICQQEHELSALWRQAMNLDYNPICDVRSADRKKLRSSIIPVDPCTSIPELLKYCTKESDLVDATPQFLSQYAAQIKGLRFIEPGGLFRDYQALGAEPEDLIGAENGNIGANAPALLFYWNSTIKVPRYQLEVA